jgi:hypothetical protein
VLEGTDRIGARQLAERIRQDVGAQTHDSAKGTFRATLSLGVAVYPEDGKSKQELISNADQALYAAKHSGRNRTVCHGEIARAKDAPPLAPRRGADAVDCAACSEHTSQYALAALRSVSRNPGCHVGGRGRPRREGARTRAARVAASARARMKGDDGCHFHQEREG